MTNYGTIPASTAPGGTSLDFISRGKQRFTTGLAQRRPWKEMFNYHSVGLPASFRDAIGRIRGNLAYFRLNYAIVVLAILFLGLLWHPISLIVFIVMMAVWLFLYFLRDEPLVVFHRTIDDRVVLVVLAVLTLVFLFLTNATANILYSLLIGAVLVLIHSAFRKTDDLYEDVEDGGATAFLAPGGSSSSK